VVSAIETGFDIKLGVAFCGFDGVGTFGAVHGESFRFVPLDDIGCHVVLG
jgi:hypothetical protein